MRSAVLLISQQCNLRCPYCFASDKLSVPGMMSFATFARIIRFLQKNLPRHEFLTVRLAGGEPTLNPEFTRMLRYLRRQKNIRVNLLSNGVFGADVLKELLRFSRNQLTPFFNVNDPRRIGRRKSAVIERNIAALASYNTLIGINFFSPQNSYRQVLDLAKKYGLRIRWGLTHPVGGRHAYVRPEDFPGMRKTIQRLIKDCALAHIPLVSDCSTPLCLFDEPMASDVKINTTCNPPLVIDKDMNVSLCYEPAFAHMTDFPNASALLRHVERSCAERKARAWLRECRDCIHRDLDECGGGCPHHVQCVINAAELSNNELSGCRQHFNERYREYASPGSKYIVKDILGIAECVEVDRKDHDLIRLLRFHQGLDLEAVYRKIKRLHNDYKENYFLDRIRLLNRLDIIVLWRADD